METTDDDNDTSHSTASPRHDAASAEVLTRLRGPEVPAVARGFWVVSGAIVLGVFVLVIVISFVSAANDNARIDRLKAHGVAVRVTVSDCVGNLGGSGSNATNYTCQGTYVVHGVTYHSTIGGEGSFVTTGHVVRGVADPSQPSSLTLASVVASSHASSSRYDAPTLLAVLGIVMALGYARLIRRPVASRRLD